jgi:hypothetical protein
VVTDKDKRLSDPAADTLLGILTKAGDETIGHVPVAGAVWRLVGERIRPTLEDELVKLRIQVKALAARQRHLKERIVESPEFAMRCHQVFLTLARTPQEEKREYLCHGLLNIACGAVEEDDATLLLPLVEALSLRHIFVLSYLAERVPFKDDPEESKLSAVWKRLRDRFPRSPGHDEKATRKVYECIVEDLRGRGLIENPRYAGDVTSDPVLSLSALARLLLAFIRDPLKKGEE